MKLASDSDQRRFSRISFHANVQLHLGQEVHPAHLLDIALKGALMGLLQPVAALRGKACRLKLDLGRAGEAIVMEGVVVHQEGPHVGIECRQIDVDSLTSLRRLAELNLGDATLLNRELSHLFDSR
ncbi:hypothetical protein SCT_2042 [Sulfuricella sp. T08]|uniref:PilZ domain-containing protein n=1 Tax=Sulfuricella sp. T08 TaxID=1632857 RepID=UPI00061799E6|nr:PilZ domain-containing protein [Sulfuricella sp. T08]GAO36633.1 hypothetical protein SCT_2042 [Sulfuricella sp. T08]